MKFKAPPAGAPSAPPEPRARSGRGRKAVALELVREIFARMRPLPDRASGTYHERRAARLLLEQAEARFAPRFRVSHQGFAVDLSSGAANIAAHGVIFVAFAVLPTLVGLGRVWLGEYGPAAELASHPALARFGAFMIPKASLAVSALGALALFVARFLPGATGWSVFSFIAPNLESGNVLVDELPEVPRPNRDEAGDGPFDVEAAWWKERFRLACGAAPSDPPGSNPLGRRLAVLAAHYDSARALPEAPALMGSGTLTSILKAGFAIIPAASYLGCALALGGVLALAEWAAPDAGATIAGAVGLGALWLVGLLFAATEMAKALESSNLPYVQGYNDNLSGVAAAFACLDDLAGTGERRPDAPLLMMVLTGSEENGLHGSIAFAKRVLVHAVERFGAAKVEIWNFESVSGERLRVCDGERTFSGLTRRGAAGMLEAYARSLDPSASPGPKDALIYSGAPELEPGWSFPLEVSREPMAACTDLTGFTAPRSLRKRLRILTFSSPWAKDSLERPRDYHRLEDDAESAEGYTDSIAAAALLVADAVRSGL